MLKQTSHLMRLALLDIIFERSFLILMNRCIHTLTNRLRRVGTAVSLQITIESQTFSGG